MLLYASLVITLVIRYGAENIKAAFDSHLEPFSAIFIVWLLILYLSDLYRDKFLNINLPTIQRFLFGVSLNVVLSIMFFYLFASFFRLTPKTNLFVFAAVFIALDLGWRTLLAKIYISSGWRNKILIIGNSPVVEEIKKYLFDNPHLGYDVITEINDLSKIKNLKKLIAESKADTVIIPPHFKKDPTSAKNIYKLLASNVAITDSTAFYETIFQKLAFEELEESWFVEKIITHRPFYDIIKRTVDAALSLILTIILSPLMLLITILIKLNSGSPIIYKDERIGFNDKTFTLYKFRIMIANHNGPLVTSKNDARFTFIGKILNYTHLNEIPQLFNILKGNMSFIGPRPESAKLVEIYKQLPYYDLRHIIKPGLTGWAQVNYKASTSLDEAKEKLRYDIYYIKNRSIALDFIILLKTIKYFFTSLK